MDLVKEFEKIWNNLNSKTIKVIIFALIVIVFGLVLLSFTFLLPVLAIIFAFLIIVFIVYSIYKFL